ncbi:hypothetical protein ACET3Z_012948 [Daucus carota]
MFLILLDFASIFSIMRDKCFESQIVNDEESAPKYGTAPTFKDPEQEIEEQTPEISWILKQMETRILAVFSRRALALRRVCTS